MASERPVVSTRLAGIPELVVDGQTGMLAPPGDSTALAQTLEQLLRDPELRLRFGHGGDVSHHPRRLGRRSRVRGIADAAATGQPGIRQMVGSA